MKSLILIVTMTAATVIGAPAFCDDSSDMQNSRAMKDCMERQKATNSSMTQAAMETVCKNEAKQKDKNGNNLATGPQAPPQK